jgi:hypothetical protein
VAGAGIVALSLAAALLLPLGGAPATSAQRNCCGDAGVCPMRAQGKPGSTCRHLQTVRPRCHGAAAPAAEPNPRIVCPRHCSDHGGPVGAAPLRDEHRSPAVRFQYRVTLSPRASLAAEPAPALQAGFAEPATPPPRRFG